MAACDLRRDVDRTALVPELRAGAHHAEDPAGRKPDAITKFIAPTVLWWFRYAALATVVTGLLLAPHEQVHRGSADAAVPASSVIGVGMWMALVMAFNVWFIIWPNQQKILGLVEATAERRAAAAPKALYASRFTTMFSIGMLYCMVAQQNAPI